MLVVTDNKNYQDIADAIREKGIEGNFIPSQMAEAILNIEQTKIGVAYCNPASSSLTAQFEVLGNPKWFAMTMIISTTNGSTTSGKCVYCYYDGSKIFGINSRGSLVYSETAYSFTQENGVLTISSKSRTDGGYMHHATSGNVYALIYGY